MEETLYFAYGSNINLEQMEHRCPDAQLVGPVTLQNYELQFRGSGFATVAPKKDCVVHGLLWKLTPKSEQALDRYEGYPRHYTKDHRWRSRFRHGLHHGRTNVPPACIAVPILLSRDPARLRGQWLAGGIAGGSVEQDHRRGMER